MPLKLGGWHRAGAAPPARCGMASIEKPISWAQMISTANGSLPAASSPCWTGLPARGPLPCMPMMPSTSAKTCGSASYSPMMVGLMPFMWMMFLGQP